MTTPRRITEILPANSTHGAFVSPLDLSPEQRRANLSALNARMVRATAKVASDASQSSKVRAAAKRDNATARRIAR